MTMFVQNGDNTRTVEALGSSPARGPSLPGTWQRIPGDPLICIGGILPAVFQGRVVAARDRVITEPTLSTGGE